MAEEMTLEQIYALYDRDGDGLVTAEQLHEKLTQEGFEVPLSTLKAIILLATKTGEFKILKSEFRKFILIILETENFEDILYRIADLDGNGVIDEYEFGILRDKMGWSLQFPGKEMTREQFIKYVGQYLEK
ncbi:Calmodulin [Hexamita inflata]|uniref:Calmodulin n=1 Tax=Hexamita inflata TaxID=28002 RepID=A0AA86REF1_9EUKA|nr:Calmodulin [Hexamita inflata]CAI9971462.1 Calmodulin [Hexamita inflata]CAI9972391.1 Calmodulin [Hexamita inflata]